MRAFEPIRLPEKPDAIAPDGTLVRLLAALAGGSLAHFELPAGRRFACGHPSHGRGNLVFRRRRRPDLAPARREGERHRCRARRLPDDSARTHFQFRATRKPPLAFLAATMPPWPGETEAFRVAGPLASDRP